MSAKKYLMKRLIIYFSVLIIISIIGLIYTFLLYNGKVQSNEKNVDIVTFIMGIFVFFILGLIKGICEKKNGLIEGLISGLFVIFIVLIINFFLKIHFTSSNFIKIAVYLILSSVGGVIGVNIKK